METLTYIIKSIAILGIFYVIYMIVLRRETFFTANRHYLIGGILAAILLPFLEFETITYVPAPVVEELPFINNFDGAQWETMTPAETQFTIDWPQVLLVIYSIGVSVMITRFFIQLLSLQRLIKSGTVVARNRFNYIAVAQDITPFSFFKYIVYNPQLHSQEDQEMILAHEQVHASQLHSIDVLLTQVALALQWCNPIAWLYKNSIEQNLEYIADSTAAQQAQSHKKYQRTLVKVSSTSYRPALTTNFYHSLIKKRIVMLNKPASQRRNLLKLGLILPALALFMYSFHTKEVVQFEEVDGDNYAFAKPVLSRAEVAETPLNTLNITIKKDFVLDDFNNVTVDLFTKGIVFTYGEVVRNENGTIASMYVITHPAGSGEQQRYTITESSVGKGISDATLSFSLESKKVKKVVGFTTANLFRTSKALGNFNTFQINKFTTDNDLRFIETYFKEQFENTKVKFEKVNHIDGKLKSFDFLTKMGNQERFVTRFSVKPTNETFKPYTITPIAENDFIIVQGDSKMKVTDKQTLTTFNQNKETESLGENPVLIVNGRVVSKTATKVNFSTTDGVSILYPTAAVQKYGIVAQDGAFVINDPNNTTIVNGKYLSTPKVNIINDKTSDTEIEAIEAYFNKNHPDALVNIYNTKRDPSGILVRFGIRVKLEGATSWRNILEVKNPEAVAQGMQVSYANSSAILLKELGPEGTTIKAQGNKTFFENDNYNVKSENLNLTQDTYRFKITKKTTIEELKALKQMLKEKHNATLDFKNVDFNAQNEITSIQLTFKDANGNSKNYSTSSDSPISDIFIYRDADGRTGMGNTASQDEIDERTTEMKTRMEERRAAMDERRTQMQKESEVRREQMQAKIEERKAQMEARMTEMKEKAAERRVYGQAQKDKNRITGYVKIESGTYYYSTKDGVTTYYDRFGSEVDEEDDIYEELINAEKDKKIDGIAVAQPNTTNTVNVSGQKIFIVQSEDGIHSNANYGGVTQIKIDKNTTDEEITSIIGKFAANDIRAKIDVTRLSTKEISRISIRLKGEGGNTTSSTFGNKKDPITTIWLGYTGNQ